MKSCAEKIHGWFACGFLRSDIVQEVVGGANAMFNAVLQRLFQPAADFSSGITCHTSMGLRMLIARMGSYISDESALKSVWGAKGSSYRKPCMICINVVRANSQYAGKGFVTVESATPSQFIMHTGKSIWTSISHTKSWLGEQP